MLFRAVGESGETLRVAMCGRELHRRLQVHGGNLSSTVQDDAYRQQMRM